jgi:hypothetical protein
MATSYRYFFSFRRKEYMTNGEFLEWRPGWDHRCRFSRYWMVVDHRTGDTCYKGYYEFRSLTAASTALKVIGCDEVMVCDGNTDTYIRSYIEDDYPLSEMYERGKKALYRKNIHEKENVVIRSSEVA